MRSTAWLLTLGLKRRALHEKSNSYRPASFQGTVASNKPGVLEMVDSRWLFLGTHFDLVPRL